MNEFLIEILDESGWVSFLDRGSEITCSDEAEAIRMVGALHQQTLGTYRYIQITDGID